MAINSSKFPPKSLQEILGGPHPIPYEAVAGDPAVNLFNGDREWSEELGQTVPQQKPQPITITIDDENLVDIINDLRGRVGDLETP